MKYFYNLHTQKQKDKKKTALLFIYRITFSRSHGSSVFSLRDYHPNAIQAIYRDALIAHIDNKYQTKALDVL